MKFKGVLMSNYKSGDIITIKGIEFVVLDTEKRNINRDGKLFILLKEPFGNTPFNNDNNNYIKSTLDKETRRWYSDFVIGIDEELIFKRDIGLLTMDGRMNYGTLHVNVAPLTFDEWRKYSRYIPKCETEYWLATGDDAPDYYGNTDRAMRIKPIGDYGRIFISSSRAVRPALVVSEALVDTPKNDGLNKYSTEQLFQELVERTKTMTAIHELAERVKKM